MIHFFTDPYKDELIYSAISRYHFYTGNIDYKDTIEECFGKRTIVPSFQIGSPIETLAKNIGGKYTADYLIRKHTILPYYLPFQQSKRQKEIIEEAKSKDCSGIYNKLGITAGSILKTTRIYYCPICANEELKNYGEAYIHREHQLQGPLLCPHDGSLLKPYRISKNDVSRLEFIRFEKKLLQLDIKANKIKHYEKLLTLSKFAYYLLENELEVADKVTILKKYKTLLAVRGLTTAGNNIKQRDFNEEFINFYGTDFLKLLNSDIDKDNEYSWLRVVTRNLKRTVHPLRHLLLINFLSKDIEGFFNDLKGKYNHFGQGPWPCLNKAADHYKRNVVKDLKITDDYKSRLSVGTFTCSCGFVYSRKGPDKEPSDRYKIGRIKSFGAVWEDKLKEYVKQNKYGLRELGRLMSCDPKTIQRFQKDSEANLVKDTKVEKDRLKEYKEVILRAVKAKPIATRNEIRVMCKKEYIYIYRRDKQWLLDNLTEKIKRMQHKALVDWNKRDEELLLIVKSSYEELINSNDAIRITKGNIGRSKGILSDLEKNLDKLPKTKEYLGEIIETVEEFQIRRCRRIIKNKMGKGEEIRLWEIQRIAGIRSQTFNNLKATLMTYIASQNYRGIYE
jgi:hypothetical protein